MCAVAAIKAFLRHRPDEGAHLVSKGFERIHIPVPTVPPRRQLYQDASAETGGSGGDSSKR